MSGPGLHVIYDSRVDSTERKAAEVDIVAVHGLNFAGKPNHATDTWSDNGSLWLKDVLPNSLERPARVMRFEYNSSPVIGASAIKLDDHAKNLLQWLKVRRTKCQQRPLILMSHSLGGLVVKEALVKAKLDTTFQCIINATCLLVFFATPHRGGNFASFGDIVAKVVRGGLRGAKNDLVESLKENADIAIKRVEQTPSIFDKLLVISFFEGEPWGKLGLIVDKKSATLGLPSTQEQQVATHANHSTICKFRSKDDPKCELVVETIAAEVERALRMKRT